MNDDDIQARIDAIVRFMNGAAGFWPLLLEEIERRERGLTEALIAQENEQIRGRLKALRDLKDLPEQLEAELRGLTEGLAE